MIHFTRTGQPAMQDTHLLPRRSSGPHQHLAHPPGDHVTFRHQPDNVVFFGRKGKVTQVVTGAALSNPYQHGQPGIQMRVRGVTNHQKTANPNPQFPPMDHNINTLADGNWKDGQKLDFAIAKRGRKARIELSVPGIGEIGWVHPEIATHIQSLIKAYPNQFRFELSNVIAGMTKGAETIGLRANLVYTGSDKKIEQQARKAFREALNDPRCREKVMHYQPETPPDKVLELMLLNEEKVHGKQAADTMRRAIDNINAQIADPKNKKILLVGHCKPDGDTIGCTVGLKHAIELAYPDKTVACGIDDKIPGLFRGKLPGVDDIKRPYNPDRIREIKDEIKQLKTMPEDELARQQLEQLEEELAELKDPSRLLDPKEKYDLVVLMDIPTPKRFTDKFKPYVNQAKAVIYMDHHPFRLNEWQDAEAWTGLNMDRIAKDGLMWVADTAPACAEMVSVLASKFPVLKDLQPGKQLPDSLKQPDQKAHLDKFVANIVTGMSTDTGSFTRTANLTPEDTQKPVEQRPNFLPEGHAKWLMALTGGTIDKKWLRENIVYDIPDKTLSGSFQAAARQIMLQHAVDGRIIKPDLSLGIVQVNYDQMNEVWQAAREADPETTLLDIQNAFKYSEVLGTLRSDPALHGRKKKSGGKSLQDKAQADYEGKYDDDRIAILICQDKEKGALDEKMQIAEDNGLRLSLRSQEGSTHAAVLASLFGGGGHGGAAGGRVDLPGVTLDTKLAVKLNGKTESDPAKILAALENNYAILKDRDASKTPIEVELVKDDQGRTTADLLTAVVGALRAKNAAGNASGKAAA